jgi:CheY-like chemotaxis protein
MGHAESYGRDALGGIYALVVDDDKERRTLVTAILRYCGALVTPTETTDEALTVMRLLKPDVILIDVTGQHDALGFIRGVRALRPDDGGTVPAIAVGAAGEYASEARAAGFDVCLTKPLDPWSLCRVVSDLVAV